jgi:hypothetical protein
MVSLILLVFAFVMACMAAFPGIRFDQYRMHLGWASIACWIASELFGRGGPYLGVH